MPSPTAPGPKDRSITPNSVAEPILPLSKVDARIIRAIPDPMSHSLTVRKTGQYIVSLLKGLRTAQLEQFPPTTTTPNVNLVLWAEGGYGDITFIYNAAKELTSRGCNVVISVLHGISKSAQKVSEILLDMGELPKMKLHIEEEHPPAEWDPDCVIIGPTKPSAALIKEAFPNLEDIPQMYLREYALELDNKAEATDPIVDYPIMSGPGPHHAGIFKSADIKEDLTTDQRLEVLSDFKAAHIKAYNALTDSLSPAEFLNLHSFYFGYAHKPSSLETFVETVALIENDPMSDGKEFLTIALPWIIDPARNWSFRGCSLKSKHTLKNAGIGHVEVIHLNRVTDKYESVPHQSIDITSDGSGKVLRIVNIFPIPNKFFTGLLDVADDVCLLTGDQSWNNAILNLSKVILYEEMTWKRDFNESIIDIAKDTECGSVADVLINWRRNEKSEFGLQNDRRAKLTDVANAISQLRYETHVAREQGVPTPAEVYHMAVLAGVEDLGTSIYNEALRLSAMKSRPLLQDRVRKEVSILSSELQVPIIIDKCIKVILDLYGLMKRYEFSFTEYTLQLFNHHEDHWLKIRTKPEVSEEVQETLDAGFEVMKKIYRLETRDFLENDRIMERLKELRVSTLPLCQKIFQDFKASLGNSE